MNEMKFGMKIAYQGVQEKELKSQKALVHWSSL